LDNEIIFSGSCCSRPNKDDSDNDLRPNSGTSSNDHILNTGISSNDQILDSGTINNDGTSFAETDDNAQATDLGLRVTMNSSPTQNIAPAQAEDEADDRLKEVGNNATGEGVRNIQVEEELKNSTQEEGDNGTQKGGNIQTEGEINNSIQEEGDNGTQEGVDNKPQEIEDNPGVDVVNKPVGDLDNKPIEEAVGEPAQVEAVVAPVQADDDEMNGIPLPGRIKSDPNLTDLAKGYPEEPSVLKKALGREDEVSVNSENENRHDWEVNSQRSGNETDESLRMDDIPNKTEATGNGITPIESENLVTGGISETNNMINGDIDFKESNLNIENSNDFEGELKYIDFHQSNYTTIYNKGFEMEFNSIYLDLSNLNPLATIFINGSHKLMESIKLVTTTGNPKIPSTVIENSLCFIDSYINNIIIVSCGFAIFMAILYITNKIYKLVTKPKLLGLENVDKYYRKIKLLSDFEISVAPTPKTRTGTLDNQVNGNENEYSSDREESDNNLREPLSWRNSAYRNDDGSSRSEERNGPNNGRPSEGNGSNNESPIGEGSTTGGNGSSTGGSSGGDEYPLEGQ
jgi:hypothetical protein